MKKKKQRKSMTGPLLIILFTILALDVLTESSPLYYKNIARYVSLQYQKTVASDASPQHDSVIGDALPRDSVVSDAPPQNSEVVADEKAEIWNADIRSAMEKGGGVSFSYNYIPSERGWDTMYSYSLRWRAPARDCNFYCVRNTLERGSEDLCSCLYSQAIWDELLSLILDNGELVDCTSVYDSNGKVTDTPIAKTVSLASGVYSPGNIDEIEAYFKKLAINAGAEASALDMNIVVDDAGIADKSSVTDLHGDFLINPVGRISDDDKRRLEAYLRNKYNGTGVRMYLILDNVDDTEVTSRAAVKTLNRATSPAMAFGITASEREWIFRYKMDTKRESALRENYSQIADAYQQGATYYDKLINAIDKAYELY